MRFSTVIGAKVDCALAGLTLGSATGIRAVRTSATPTQSGDTSGGGGGVGQDPIKGCQPIDCLRVALDLVLQFFPLSVRHRHLLTRHDHHLGQLPPWLAQYWIGKPL